MIHPTTPPTAAAAPKLRIAILEDDSRARDALRILMSAQPGIECVGTFGNATSILAGLAGTRPDVVLVDLKLPDGRGDAVIRELKPVLPDTDFVVLTGFADDDLVFEALQAGATGYLLKSDPPERLVEAIQSVRRGGSPMSPFIARKVIGLLRDSVRPTPPASRAPESAAAPEPSWTLTPRELQMIEGLARGWRYSDLAGHHGISIETVRLHLRKVYAKLHVHSRTEAVAKFVRGRTR